MNHHPRFNIVESSLAAGVKTEVRIVLDVLVMVGPETAARIGGHVDEDIVAKRPPDRPDRDICGAQLRSAASGRLPRRRILVTDLDGRRYLDCLAAYSALNFGHRHPALIEAARAPSMIGSP